MKRWPMIIMPSHLADALANVLRQDASVAKSAAGFDRVYSAIEDMQDYSSDVVDVAFLAAYAIDLRDSRKVAS